MLRSESTINRVPARETTTALMTVAILIVVHSPSSAMACSCQKNPGELGTTLIRARDAAVAVYVGQVQQVVENPPHATAWVKVLQVLKGSVTAGETLKVPAWGAGDCTPPFEEGETYLIYATGLAPIDVSTCSRTRPVGPNDLEVQWLTSGQLPPIPVALRRAVVECSRCSLTHLANELVGSPYLDDTPALKSEDVVQAAARGNPFWAVGCNGGHGCPWTAIGIGRSRRAFELFASSELQSACHVRISRRWCSQLEANGHASWPSEAVRCIDPGTAKEVCNEERTAKESWDLPEDLSAAACIWNDAEHARCVLAAPARPRQLASQEPILACRPQRSDPERYLCTVTASDRDVFR